VVWSAASGVAGSGSDTWNTGCTLIVLGSSNSNDTGPLIFLILKSPSFTASSFLLGLSDFMLRRTR